MLIVDTNVLVDVLEDDPDWAERSIGQLRAQAQVHALPISPITYAELSLAFATVEALDAVIDEMRLTVAGLLDAILELTTGGRREQSGRQTMPFLSHTSSGVRRLSSRHGQAARGTTAFAISFPVDALSQLQIILRLQVDPEFRRRAEEAPEPQCHIRRYGRLTATYQVNATLRQP